MIFQFSVLPVAQIHHLRMRLHKIHTIDNTTVKCYKLLIIDLHIRIDLDYLVLCTDLCMALY
jgi:hypothetical protein